MVPIAQAMLLESFPSNKRGAAMAMFAMGVVVAPILGPTLGGWITDNYSWRWIFYINVPFGIAAVFLQQWLVEDPPYIKRNKKADIDFIGFAPAGRLAGDAANHPGQGTGGGLVPVQLDPLARGDFGFFPDRVRRAGIYGRPSAGGFAGVSETAISPSA